MILRFAEVIRLISGFKGAVMDALIADLFPDQNLPGTLLAYLRPPRAVSLRVDL